MRVPARRATWSALAVMLGLVTGSGIASVAMSPADRRPATSASRSPSAPPTTPATPTPTTPTTTISSPSPPVEGMAQVAFLSPEDGYGLVVDQNNGRCASAVASTADGGTSFTSPAVVATWACADGYQETSLTFDGVGDGFVYGPGLYESHDGGKTWANQSPTETVLDVVPLGTSVWMLQSQCSGGPCTLSLAQSEDGGRTWQRSASFPDPVAVGNESPSWLNISWLLRTSLWTAWVAVPTTGTAVTLLSTSDGGETWRHLLVPCLGGWVENLSRAFDQTLWLACAGQPSAGSQLKSVMRSFDGGRTWVQGSACPPLVTSTTYPSCAESNELTDGYLSDIAPLSATTALIAGDRNVVQITHDGGKTWEPTNPPLGGDEGSGGLFFVNPQDGWVLVNPLGAGVLWRTTDGGEQWSQVWPIP
jgi:photosystem II stability/assembly factor-like uncharacterized protein